MQIPEHIRKRQHVEMLVRFRAQRRCECVGSCGSGHKERCAREEGERGWWATSSTTGLPSSSWMPEFGPNIDAPGSIWTVVLTMEAISGNRDAWHEANLVAMCQSCATNRQRVVAFAAPIDPTPKKGAKS